MSRLKTWTIFGLSVAILIALDLWLKHWAAANLPGEPRTLIPGFLGLRYLENPGAAFGFLAGTDSGRWILTTLNLVILGGLLWYYNRLPLEKRLWWMRVPIIFVVAGGIGNLIDRIALGIVRDMLEFQFISFPIFNLADVYVTGGVFALIFVVLFIVKDVPFR